MIAARIPAALPAALAVALTACGCAGPNQQVPLTPPPPVDQVDAIHVQCSPVPVNWDGRPGADGLRVLVLLFRRGGDLAITGSGAVEFGLYEGQLGAGELDSVKPAHAWRFEGQALRACLTRTIFGWGYAMQLGWGADAPTTSSLTLVARYLPAKGAPRTYGPLVIPTGPR
jgi:hypothetical protein